VDTIAAEELTVLPGAEEVLALLEVRAQVASGQWDLVVVDCAPTAETLRLLALPEALSWYMDRVLPVQRRVVKALHPVFSRAAGVPMPRDTVFEAVQRLHADLAEVRDLLTGPDASVRLVLTPESVVVAEARRSLTTLSLYGYRVDGVVANRIFPDAGADAWRREWVQVQTAQLAEVETSFAPLNVARSEFRPREPVGAQELAVFAEQLYGDRDPLARAAGAPPLSVERRGDQVRVRLALPLAERGEVDVVRRGDDLVVTVGSYRRVIALPSMLRAVRGHRRPARRGPAPGSVPAAGHTSAAGERRPRRRTRKRWIAMSDAHDAVGSLGEEAVKLLAAMSTWADEHTAGEAGPSGDRACSCAPAATCAWCPVCQALSTVRAASPSSRSSSWRPAWH
jgi:arsenite-transporting ATPase